MNVRRWSLLVTAVLIVCTYMPAVSDQPKSQFEDDHWRTAPNVIDKCVSAFLSKKRVGLRSPCSDAVFIRRVYIDVIGTLPQPQEVDSFLKDTNPEKRARLIDNLLSRDEFADYWSLKWCDVLKVKSEFPINLWPNAVQVYHRWVYDAIRRNMPYDKFAWELLTSSGSNFRNPPVNFYRAVPSRGPDSIAKSAALTFMGVGIENWPAARRSGMAAFFSRVAYKKTQEWKEEIVYSNPVPAPPLKAVFPDGATVTIPPNTDPRLVFAKWLITPGNQWFARNIVNRIWGWTMGQGIIDPVDDIRPDNPAGSPELLSVLEKELIDSHYDLRHIYRLILNSRIYQQSSIPHGDDASDLRFTHYTIRRLDAEVLIDALSWIAGQGESYSSAIPEPYTFIPKEKRTITLADGSITSSFLATFGRPSRDTGLQSDRSNLPTDTQSAYLLNSTDIQWRIQRSPLLQVAIRSAHGNWPQLIGRFYLILLSRYPTPSESAIAEQYFKRKGMQPRQAATDLAWALINGKEFLYRH